MYLRWTFHVPRGTVPMTARGQQTRYRCSLWRRAGGEATLTGWRVLFVQSPVDLALGRLSSSCGERSLPGWGDCGGRGKDDLDVEASAAAGVDGEGGVVCFGDGGDDGQAEAEAFVAGGPAGRQALEGLEQPGGLAAGDVRAGVGDLERGVASACCPLDVEPAAGDVVAQRVVYQVGGEPLEQAGVAEDGRGGDREADRQAAGSSVRLAGVQGVDGDVREVDRLSAVKAPLAASQRQQRFDQLFLLLACFEYVLARGLVGRQGRAGVGECHLQQGASQSERGAQLMGGIGDEVPLGGEGAIQPFE